MMAMNFRHTCVAFPLMMLFVLSVDTRAQEPATTEKPAIPAVVLSEQHEKLCKVKVGDPLPALELKTLAGGEQSLPELYNKNATVVLFWNGDGWMTRAALRDLGRSLAELVRQKKVAAVTIAVNQSAEVTQAALEKAESKLITLLDPYGKAFAQVGKEKLPRVFVLDGAGKIVWFDLEYSHTTRRELRQAVDALTAK